MMWVQLATAVPRTRDPRDEMTDGAVGELGPTVGMRDTCQERARLAPGITAAPDLPCTAGPRAIEFDSGRAPEAPFADGSGPSTNRPGYRSVPDGRYDLVGLQHQGASTTGTSRASYSVTQGLLGESGGAQCGRMSAISRFPCEADWSPSLICTRLRLEDSMNASRQHQDEEVPHL